VWPNRRASSARCPGNRNFGLRSAGGLWRPRGSISAKTVQWNRVDNDDTSCSRFPLLIKHDTPGASHFAAIIQDRLWVNKSHPDRLVGTAEMPQLPAESLQDCTLLPCATNPFERRRGLRLRRGLRVRARHNTRREGLVHEHVQPGRGSGNSSGTRS